MTTGAYLRRLGIGEALPPTLDSLRLLQRRHLEQVPFENLEIMIGPAPSVDPVASLERVAEVGRGGYCLHQNAVLEVVLRDLGFDVERRHGHVWNDAWTDPARADEPTLDHLALVVSGLPTEGNPGGRWWADVGLGEGFVEPLPLTEGEHLDGPFRFRLEAVDDHGWRFVHDPAGSFGGLVVTNRPTDPMTVLEAHARLSTPPEGRFTRLLVAQRRDADGLDAVRGCVRLRIGATGRHATDLTSYDDWRAALLGLGVSLEGVATDALRRLWRRSLAGHRAWVAAGRP